MMLGKLQGPPNPKKKEEKTRLLQKNLSHFELSDETKEIRNCTSRL